MAELQKKLTSASANISSAVGSMKNANIGVGGKSVAELRQQLRIPLPGQSPSKELLKKRADTTLDGGNKSALPVSSPPATGATLSPKKGLFLFTLLLLTLLV